MKQKIALHLQQKKIQQQKLILSQKMRLFLQMLHLPVTELKEFLEKEINSNPLLEKIEKPSFFIKKEVFQDPFASIAKKESLYEHLLLQARELFSKKEMKVASYLIGNINQKGFLEGSLEEFSSFLKVSKKEIFRILKIIQTFDPIGIAARNIQESLLLQLKAKKMENSLCFHIVKHYFSDLLHGKRAFLMKMLKISHHQWQQILKDLKILHFHITANFSLENSLLIVPDIFIFYEDKKWKIVINYQDLPFFTINKKYRYLLQKKEEKDFVKKHLCHEKYLQQALQNRASTLKKIAIFLIIHQKDYLLGNGSLLPCTYQKAALFIKIHLSTVARSIANKYIACPLGLLPLKSFFSPSIKNRTFSQQQALEMLKTLIAKENKNHPLSDEMLAKEFSSLGISCSRRTICKYRKKLLIPSRNKRSYLMP